VENPAPIDSFEDLKSDFRHPVPRLPCAQISGRRSQAGYLDCASRT
jgi:hypothetical protein